MFTSRPALAVLLALPIAGFVVSSSAETLYVDDDASILGDGRTWATAFNDIQDALDIASTNGLIDTIRVAEGSYFPDRGTGDRNAHFSVVNGVSLIGGYAGVRHVADLDDSGYGSTAGRERTGNPDWGIT